MRPGPYPFRTPPRVDGFHLCRVGTGVGRLVASLGLLAFEGVGLAAGCDLLPCPSRGFELPARCLRFQHADGVAVAVVACTSRPTLRPDGVLLIERSI